MRPLCGSDFRVASDIVGKRCCQMSCRR